MDKISETTTVINKNSTKKKIPISFPKITPQIFEKFYLENNIDNNSGILQIDDTHYSVCFEYSDISFAKASLEEQENLLLKYASFLNSHNETQHIQIIHTSTILEADNYKSRFILPLKSNSSHNETQITNELNNLVSDVIGNKNELLIETRLIVVTTVSNDYSSAKAFFSNYQLSLEDTFKKIGSKVKRWSNHQRLELIYNTFNENSFHKDFPEVNNIIKYAQENNITTYDVLSPKQAIDLKQPKFIKISENKYLKVLYLSSFPKSLTPRFYNEITTIQGANLVVTENISPTDPTKIIKMLDKKISGMKTDRLKKVKNAQKNNYDYSYVRDEKLDDKIDNAQKLRDALTKKKQKLFMVNFLICILGDSQAEIDTAFEKISKISATHLITFKSLSWQQLEGLQNLLPLGHNTLQFQRSLTSEACATSVPFNTKQLLHDKSIYYGINLITRDVVFADRKKLMNGNGCVLATSGGGKSFFCKLNIEQAYLRYPKDDIIIIDPNGEYAPVVDALNGETIEISTLTKTYINPFDISSKYSDKSNDPIKTKVEYILAFVESIVGGSGLTGVQKTIVDRCAKNILEGYVLENNHLKPDLPLFYNEIKKCPEPEAKNLSLILERYVSGSMDIFAKHTNVQITNRLVSFDISNLTSSFQTTGYLVVLEFIMNKISQNKTKGKNTWVWIDEFHILLSNQFSADYIEKIFKIGRKFGALPTVITQNISDVVSCKQGQNILSNSECAILLKQKPLDMPPICKIFNISDEELTFIDDSPQGQGLLVYGNDKIPFKNTVPEDYYIYKLNQTSQLLKSRL